MSAEEEVEAMADDLSVASEEDFQRRMELLNQVALSTLDGQEIRITVGMQSLNVIVASTLMSRKRGLGTYQSLPSDGMLFIYTEDNDAPFTRDPMNFNIAIWFFDDEGQLFDFDRESPIARASSPYRYVLETDQELDLHGTLQLH